MIVNLLLLFGFLSSANAALPPVLQGKDLISGTPSQLKRAKYTIVLFLSAKCPCSQSHEKVLSQLAKEFSGPDFRFVGLHSNADETFDFASAHFKQSGLPFAVLSDENHRWADELKAFKTPHVFVLSEQDQVIFQGGVDDRALAENATKHYLRETLEALKDHKAPPRSKVRVLGCEIKRKL